MVNIQPHWPSGWSIMHISQLQYTVKQTVTKLSPCYFFPWYNIKLLVTALKNLVSTGREINFFSDSHLAPKFIKVVANSKKIGRHFERQTKPFFYVFIVLEIKLGKISFTCNKVDTRMDDMQHLSSPKSKMASNLIEMHLLHFGNKLNKEVCRGFVFANLFNSLYL